MEKRDIKFLRVTHLRGPNIWTYRPVLEAWIDIGVLEDFPSNTLPGFVDRLTAWLPSLMEHRCSYGEYGGFVRRLREGTWPGHILEHVTLELQNLAGMPGGFGKAREMSQRGHYKVIVRAWQEDVTRAALQAARELVLAAIEDQPFDVAATVEDLKELADRRMIGPSTACIVDAAHDRLIPYIRLTEGNLVQLGYGARQRRIWTAETDRTSAIAEGISRDKDLTKSLLQACGVPVPEGREVASAEDAWEAAEEIGLPVVVKPVSGNHGRGVFVDLNTREQVERAYHAALRQESGVMVERFVRGDEHRLLVVGGRLVAAAKGESAWVVADGQHSLADLVDVQLNSDPRRGDLEEHPLNPVRLGSATTPSPELEQQGYNRDSIPPAGKRILVQLSGNMDQDVTDLVHPRVAAVAALAAKVVGLDIAGIDLVAEDISQPLHLQQGAIVEVNAGPGLLMHLKPAQGEPRAVGKAIADHLFPPGEFGRIPVIGVTGTNGKTVTARLVARLLQLAGQHVGLACSDGLYLDQRRMEAGDSAHFEAGERVLMNRSVECAVIESGSGTLLGEGLPYERCQVAVVHAIDSGDHLGDYDIQTAEKMFDVFRTAVDVVLPEGTAVLSARDPKVAEMAPLCDGAVIFFALDGQLPAIVEHRAKGKRAVFVQDGNIVLANGAEERVIAELAAIPLTRGGQVAYHVENVLAAVGVAWALDLPEELTVTGIETFNVGQTDAPGRFTVFGRDGATVVVDAAHNAAALGALVAAAERLPARRRSAVFAGGNDRPQDDVAVQGKLLAGAFSRVFLCHDETAGARTGAETAQALAAAIEAEGRGVKVVACAQRQDALAQGLAHLECGDLLVVQCPEGAPGEMLNRLAAWAGQRDPNLV